MAAIDLCPSFWDIDRRDSGSHDQFDIRISVSIILDLPRYFLVGLSVLTIQTRRIPSGRSSSDGPYTGNTKVHVSVGLHINIRLQSFFILPPPPPHPSASQIVLLHEDYHTPSSGSGTGRLVPLAKTCQGFGPTHRCNNCKDAGSTGQLNRLKSQNIPLEG